MRGRSLAGVVENDILFILYPPLGVVEVIDKVDYSKLCKDMK